MAKQFEGPNSDKYVLLTSPRSDILKAMEPKIGEFYGLYFGKREYSQLPNACCRQGKS